MDLLSGKMNPPILPQCFAYHFRVFIVAINNRCWSLLKKPVGIQVLGFVILGWWLVLTETGRAVLWMLPCKAGSHCLLNIYCRSGASHYCCSVTKSCLTLCDPMGCSMPGLPVPHHLLEFPQGHVHWIGDYIQPSHPLLPCSPFAFNLSQHQGFSNESAVHIR